MSLNKAQRVTWLKKWWPQIATSLGCDPGDENARQAFYGATFRDIPRHAERIDSGERIRFRHLDQSDFDRLKRAWQIAVGSADLNTALTDDDPDRPCGDRAKRMMHKVSELNNVLRLEHLHPNPDAAINKILRDRFAGRRPADMRCRELHELIITINRWIISLRRKKDIAASRRPIAADPSTRELAAV